MGNKQMTFHYTNTTEFITLTIDDFSLRCSGALSYQLFAKWGGGS